MSRVSIVTPLYRGERFLDELLASVGRQTFMAWEHLLVDDGSPDGSRQIVERWMRDEPRIRLIVQENRGVTHARNRGAAEASPEAEYLLFLDQDDLLEPDALARLVGHLEAHPDAQAAFGTAVIVGEKGEVWENRSPRIYCVVQKRIFPSKDRRLTFDHFVPVNPIYTPGQCLIRRDAFVQTAGFDARLALVEDWDLWLQLTRGGGAVDYLDSKVIRWRQHAENNSRRYRSTQRQRRRLYRKYLRDPAPQIRASARLASAFGQYGFYAERWRQALDEALARRSYRSALCALQRLIRCRIAQRWETLALHWMQSKESEIHAA